MEHPLAHIALYACLPEPYIKKLFVMGLHAIQEQTSPDLCTKLPGEHFALKRTGAEAEAAAR